VATYNVLPTVLGWSPLSDALRVYLLAHNAEVFLDTQTARFSDGRTYTLAFLEQYLARALNEALTAALLEVPFDWSSDPGVVPGCKVH